jgi:hypothetical protein
VVQNVFADYNERCTALAHWCLQPPFAFAVFMAP